MLFKSLLSSLWARRVDQNSNLAVCLYVSHNSQVPCDFHVPTAIFKKIGYDGFGATTK
jgi:hypothetical protein